MLSLRPVAGAIPYDYNMDLEFPMSLLKMAPLSVVPWIKARCRWVVCRWLVSHRAPIPLPQRIRGLLESYTGGVCAILNIDCGSYGDAEAGHKEKDKRWIEEEV